MMRSDDEQYEQTPNKKQTDDEMRAASERHQINTCIVRLRSCACAVPHTVAMRHMTPSYQCMLQSVFGELLYTADILSILASAKSSH